MSALAPAGSGRWLLLNDLRLGVRGFLQPKSGSNRGRIRLIVIAVVLVGLGVTVGASLVHQIARTRIRPTPMLFFWIDTGLAWLWTLMLAQTLVVSTQIFYERNDLDLLLSSPIAPRKVLTVRALGIALLASTLYLILASILVLPLAAAGRPEFLAVYGVILSLALLATAAGLSLALALFAWIGPRRTRTVSQVLAAVVGATIFIASQSRNLLPQATWERLTAHVAHLDMQRFDPNAPYAWPARAFLGDPLALLVVAGLALLAFAASTAATGRRFAQDAAAGAGVFTGGDARTARRRAAAGDRAGFRSGVLPSLVRKDLRLLARDPWLISQLGLQLVYFVFLTIVAVRAAGRNGPLALGSGAAALVFICGQLSGNLTWVVISAEDAPELIASAPVAPRQVATAKLFAGLAPTALCAALPVLVFAFLSPAAALVAAFGMAGAAGSSALMNLWYAKPANRREFRRRRGAGGWAGLIELLLMFGWAITTAMLVYALSMPLLALVALVPLALCLGTLAVMRRPQRYGVAMPA